MRTPIIAANWKMNKTTGEAAAFFKGFLPAIASAAGRVEVVVIPPFTALAACKAAAGGAVAVGAQNMHPEASGAFTGEISAGMLVDLGVSHVVLGHSERRTLFGETDGFINQKVKAALAAGLTPILCVGETLEERDAGKVREVLDRQVAEGLAGLEAGALPKVVIAYEPVWAIGTGRTATPAQAQEAHAMIRARLGGLFGAEAAERVRIQYGGSVKPGNARELLACPDIDGALVGGASLVPEDFAAIVLAAV